MERVTEYVKLMTKLSIKVTHIQLLTLYGGLLTSTRGSKSITRALSPFHKSNDIYSPWYGTSLK